MKVLDELENVFTYLDEILEPVDIEPDRLFTLRLVVEEIFANMVKHNNAGSKSITLSLCLDGSGLQVELIDHGVEPFDVADVNSNDMDESARTGKTSGRGIYLIRQMVDELEYEYCDGDSHVRFSINLGSTHA